MTSPSTFRDWFGPPPGRLAGQLELGGSEAAGGVSSPSGEHSVPPPSYRSGDDMENGKNPRPIRGDDDDAPQILQDAYPLLRAIVATTRDEMKDDFGVEVERIALVLRINPSDEKTKALV